jgi:uncharacterized protein (DUF2164 family)
MEISFSSEEKASIVPRIQRYLAAELDLEAGAFEAEFLLDFFTREIGGYFYNRGLYDARALLDGRLEEIADALYALEKPTEFSR